MTRTHSKSSGDVQALVDQVTTAFVHRLFPEFRLPAYLACPDDECADLCRSTISLAAKKRKVKTEVVDLKPAPAVRLNAITVRLRDINDRTNDGKQPWPTLLILDGFDLLEGSNNDPPIYPFRSRFQFDREHLWLFMGRDMQRLRRMFGDRRLPLYHAASNITPESWSAVVNPLKRAMRRHRETR